MPILSEWTATETWSGIESLAGQVMIIYTQLSKPMMEDLFRPALTTPGLILLIKLDESGGLVWSKTFDIDSYQEGRGVVQTPDGRYCIAGYVSSSNNNNKGYLIKTDSSGNLVWTKTYQ